MAIAAQLNQRFTAIDAAFVAVFPPPPIQGLGTTGGFKLQIEDRANKGFEVLFNNLQAVINGEKRSSINGAYTQVFVFKYHKWILILTANRHLFKVFH